MSVDITSQPVVELVAQHQVALCRRFFVLVDTLLDLLDQCQTVFWPGSAALLAQRAQIFGVQHASVRRVALAVHEVFHKAVACLVRHKLVKQLAAQFQRGKHHLGKHDIAFWVFCDDQRPVNVGYFATAKQHIDVHAQLD